MNLHLGVEPPDTGWQHIALLLVVVDELDRLIRELELRLLLLLLSMRPGVSSSAQQKPPEAFFLLFSNRPSTTTTAQHPDGSERLRFPFATTITSGLSRTWWRRWCGCCCCCCYCCCCFCFIAARRTGRAGGADAGGAPVLLVHVSTIVIRCEPACGCEANPSGAVGEPGTPAVSTPASHGPPAPGASPEPPWPWWWSSIVVVEALETGACTRLQPRSS
mmetsp:Transcript_27790/g.57009  ORF Transcript_27790/g.57009 Transcript_27790/m.57009 type:complete len:219 (-) Transcript_27790:38-694(-)